MGPLVEVTRTSNLKKKQKKEEIELKKNVFPKFWPLDAGNRKFWPKNRILRQKSCLEPAGNLPNP